MMMEIKLEYVLFLASLLLFLSVYSTKYASKFGVPYLLFTLAIGILFGNGGKYDFDFNYPELSLHISEIALAFIIFIGGIESNWKRFKPILLQGIMLSSVGVIATALTVGMFIYLVFGWPILPSLLVGCILSSTDAAAVFSILSGQKIKLKKNTAEVLELESGTNDPMAFFLTIGISALILNENQSIGFLFLDFLKSMGIGLVSGYLIGRIIYWFILRVNLTRGHNTIMMLCVVILIYSFNKIVGGSYFLALYVAGITLSNYEWEHKEYNLSFFESISWLMETILFLILGLQVYIFKLDDVLLDGLTIALVLIFIARPIGVFLSYAFIKEKQLNKVALVSWVGLRGATPIVFALIPLVIKVPNAETYFNLSFIVVIVSILLQGLTVSFVARKLKMVE